MLSFGLTAFQIHKSMTLDFAPIIENVTDIGKEILAHRAR
jgi:hypothetical protein